MTSSSNRPRHKSSSQREREKARESAVQIKCKFCGNTFMAQPRLAVCAKCGRPANKGLDTLWLATSFFLPLVGFINSLIIRTHSPVAATQGIWASIFGSVAFTVVYAVLRGVTDIF